MINNIYKLWVFYFTYRSVGALQLRLGQGHDPQIDPKSYAKEILHHYHHPTLYQCGNLQDERLVAVCHLELFLMNLHLVEKNHMVSGITMRESATECA